MDEAPGQKKKTRVTLTSGGTGEYQMNQSQTTKKSTKTTLYAFLFFMALFLFGINANEPQRVLEQAWNICLDCIGIG